MRIDPYPLAHGVNELPHAPHASNAGRFRDAVDRARSATPSEATPLPETWSADDVRAFEVFAEANRRTESGGTATFSTLRTTAGPAHRASFGVAQLSIREHLERLARESDARLESFGTSRTEVDAMRARGDAAEAFYHLVVDGRDLGASAAQLGLEASEAAQAEALAASGDANALRAALGDRFTRRTGLPASALDALVRTRVLRDPAIRDAFRAQYEADHAAPFDPMHRDASAMVETVRHLVLAHPELEPVLGAMGGDDPARTSVAHYLGVGDSAENLLGWHARAASSAVGPERLEGLLARIDDTTSRAREVADFEHALRAVAAVSDLEGGARVATLARIGRIFHGAPTRAREALFEDGRLDRPRCRTRAELDALLDEMRSGRRWSDARLAGHVAEVVAERGRS